MSTDFVTDSDLGLHTRHPELARAYDLAARKEIMVAIDLDGATLSRAPGVHIAEREHFLADNMIRIAEKCPAGPITGRPIMFPKTALEGLLSSASPLKTFAATEAGALIVDAQENVLFEKKVTNIDKLAEKFRKIILPYSGAMIEDHTMCSVIVGLTSVCASQVDEVHKLLLTATIDELSDSGYEIVSGKHIGVNVHMNVVPEGVHKGAAMHFIMNQPGFETYTPISFGDSEPDMKMFEAGATRNGISVGVGKSDLGAAIRVKDHRDAQTIIGNIAHLVHRMN